MTQEDKQLLLKDLCARLPYEIKVWYPNGNGAISTVKGIVGDICYFNENPIHGNFCRIETVKPYLRPMSSMTEEECKELGELSATIENVGETLPNVPYYIEVARPEQIDWLNAHHFDYRGLIENGLALEAPEDMYDRQI